MISRKLFAVLSLLAMPALAQSPAMMVDLNTTVNKDNDSVFEEPRASMNGELYFFEDDGVHGFELWRTDGTGAILLKDYAPGATRSNNGIVELGNSGEIDVQGQTFVKDGQVHFILDVTGHFQ